MKITKTNLNNTDRTICYTPTNFIQISATSCFDKAKRGITLRDTTFDIEVSLTYDDLILINSFLPSVLDERYISEQREEKIKGSL